MTRPTRARRRLGALLGAAAVAAGALTAFDPGVGRAVTPSQPSSGQPSSGQLPVSFSGGAAAVAVHEEASPKAGFAVAEPFYGSFADGLTTYDQNGASARASTFYPGPTLSSPGSLICQLNCVSVPAYPLSVYTNGTPPTVSEQSSTPIGGTGQPASGEAASADATAYPSGTQVGTGPSTEAVFGSLASPAPAGGSSSQAGPGAGLPAVQTSAVRTSAVRTSAARTSKVRISTARTSAARTSAARHRASTRRASSSRSARAAATLRAENAVAARVSAAAAALRQKVAAILHRPLPLASGHLAGLGTAAASPSSAVVQVGSATASTSQYFTFVGSNAVLNTDAETVLSGVSLLSGAVQISSIVTKSVATSGGTAKPTQTNTVTVSGVTVEGVAATIDDKGISVQGQGTGAGPLQSVNNALQSALAAAGANVTLIGVTAKPPQPLGALDCADQQADGVYVQAGLNANAVPVVGDTYNLDYTLGSTCAQAQTAGGSSPAGTVTVSGPAGAAVSHPGGAASAPASSAPASSPPASSSFSTLPSGGGSEALGATSAPSGSTAAPAPSASRPTAAVLGPLTSSRFSYLYLSVVLALVALLVGGGTQLRTVGRRARAPALGADR